MGSSSSSLTKKSTGWVYFYTEGKWTKFENHKVLDYFEDKLKADEEIIVYADIRKTAHSKVFGKWHEYMLVETQNVYTDDKSYWSFEEDADGLNVQKSSDFDQIRNYFGKTKRGWVRGQGKIFHLSYEGTLLYALECFIERDSEKDAPKPDQKALKGGTWINRLYFHIDCDWKKLEEPTILEFFENEEKAHEEIIIFSEIRKHNLQKFVPGLFGNWHEYTLVTTINKHTKNKSYWSFEKNMLGLHVQRSSDERQVRRYLGAVERNQDRSEGRSSSVSNEESMLKSLKWIINRSELTNSYNLLLQNCQYFASLFYEAITRTAGDRRLSRTYSICDLPRMITQYLYFYKGNGKWIRLRSYQIRKYFVEELNADKEIIVELSFFFLSSSQLWKTKNVDSNTTMYWSFDSRLTGYFVQRHESDDQVRCYFGGQERQNKVISPNNNDFLLKMSVMDRMQIVIDRGFSGVQHLDIFSGMVRRAIG